MGYLVVPIFVPRYFVINCPIILTTGNIYINYMMATLAGWGIFWDNSIMKTINMMLKDHYVFMYFKIY